MSDSSSDDDTGSTPGEEYNSNHSSDRQRTKNSELADESNDFEPRSPGFDPPASPSEDDSSNAFKKRKVFSNDSNSENPHFPDAPESPDKQDGDGPRSPASDDNSEDDDDNKSSDKEEHDVGDIIADIFGEDEADEEFKGFKEAEERGSDSDTEVVHRPKVKFHSKVSHDEAPSQEPSSSMRPGVSFPGESDFDRIMHKRRDEQRRRRQRSKGMRSGAKLINVASLDADEREAMNAGVDDIVQDGDEIAIQLIGKMTKAAKEDGELLEKGDLACKKLLLLQEAVDLIANVDFQASMFDNGILGSITDWLLPLQDGSLPNIKIRSELLRLIQQFPPLNSDQLKDSGLGKAIMILAKHPKEIRTNKTIARKLINDWSRSIFNLSDHSAREEREHLELERVERRKRRLSKSGAGSSEPDTSQPVAKKPGDPGWIYRARVPQLSGKDYVVKPEWQVSDAPKPTRKEPVSRYEKHARNIKDRSSTTTRKRHSAPSFVKFSVEGRNVF